MNNYAKRRGGRHIVLALGLLAPVLLLWPPGRGPVAAAPDVAEVRIDNFTFSPAELTIKAGTKVVFRNSDDIPHSVVMASVGVHSKALDTDDTFSFEFNTPGTIDYFCGLHPHMKGKIIVVPQMNDH